MRHWARFILSGILTIGLVFPAALLKAQDKQDKQDKKDKKEKQETDKEKKKKEERLRRELETPYKKWLNEEVTYIITDEERATFKKLATNEEREQFIEQFWLRRDPTPDTIENEDKEEHYRRIAYSNERFASGVPGWKTDRGRTYIIWGPPDELSTHPTGGMYERPYEEGGGSTSTFPFETWRYRYLEGLGNEVILEFVDPSGSGEYHLTMDPSEKDALLHVPGAGLSEMESMGMASKTDRFSRSDGTHLPTTMGGQPASMNQFERLSQYAKIQRPPPTKFRDLEQLVTSRIVRNQIDFDYRFDFLRVTDDSVLVPFTVQIPNKQLTFKNDQGVHSATLNLFGRITTVTGRVVQTFEDVIQRDFPESLLQTSLAGSSIYQKAVPLRPGLYRLDLVIKDVNSGNVGVANLRVAVPRYESDKLSSSTLIVADQIEKVPAKQIGLGQFVLGASKVRPRLDKTFTVDERMGIYMQVYNLEIDETTHKPSATIEYLVEKDKKEIQKVTETSQQLGQSGEQITLEKLVALTGLEPGNYKLNISVTDNVSKQTLTPAPSVEFTIKASPKGKAAAAADKSAAKN
ncbi:MAG: GWxTD domain-containing protein [Acidobacteria bacterium]|nr:GWxTD domain-containing protein [Acidobacteriota bacterium]